MKKEWVLKRNCSISPRQLASVYALLSAVSLSVAAAWAFRGFWYVVGFAIPELLAVGVAFLLYARHAGDGERIVLAETGLLIERREGRTTVQSAMDSRFVAVELPDRYRGLVELRCSAGIRTRDAVEEGTACWRSSGSRMEVGRFVSQPVRRQFALELQGALAREPGA